MKMPLLCSFLLICIHAAAQNMEGYAGLGINHFFDKGYNDHGHYQSHYNPGLAKCLGIGLTGKLGIFTKFNVTLQYTTAEGAIHLNYGSLGASINFDASSKLNSLDLGIYPLTMDMQWNNMKGHFEIQMGAELGYQFGSKINGQVQVWTMDYDFSTNPPTTKEVHETRSINSHAGNYFTDFNAQLSLKLGYSIPFGQNCQLVPRFHSTFGLTKRYTSEVDSRPFNRTTVFELALRYRRIK